MLFWASKNLRNPKTYYEKQTGREKGNCRRVYFIKETFGLPYNQMVLSVVLPLFRFLP